MEKRASKIIPLSNKSTDFITENLHFIQRINLERAYWENQT